MPAALLLCYIVTELWQQPDELMGRVGAGRRRPGHCVRPFVAGVLLVLAPWLQAQLSADPPSYWGSLEAGPHAVRFEHLQLVDEHRSYGDMPQRSLSVGLWYPATGVGETERLPFRIYLDAFETDPEQWLNRLAEQSARRQALKLQTAASTEGSAIAKSSPLIVYGPGYRSTPTIHAAFAEYLASHGYVVASSGSVGARPGGMTFDSEGLTAQVDDMLFIIASLATNPRVDARRIGVSGFSFGGSAALLAAMREPRIGAVVSLDGAETMAHAFSLIESAKGFAETCLQVPYLRFGQAAPASASDALVTRMRQSHRFWIQLSPAEHIDFIPSASFAAAATDTDGEKQSVRHQTQPSTIAARLMLRFFDATIAKKRPEGLQEDLELLMQELPPPSQSQLRQLTPEPEPAGD